MHNPNKVITTYRDEYKFNIKPHTYTQNWSSHTIQLHDSPLTHWGAIYTHNTTNNLTNIT